MLEPGHVFVFHGNLLHLAADGFLVPADEYGDVMDHWKRLYDAALTIDLRTQLKAGAFSEPILPRAAFGTQVVRYVNTGFSHESADPEKLFDNVRAGLEAIAADVNGRTQRRARPLVAMPLFGTGEGGFNARRGEALNAVLRAADKISEATDVDIAITCFERSDYTALQSCRQERSWEIGGDIRGELDRVADTVRRGGVVLFMGAGVSVPAGLPLFKDLIETLEARADITGIGDLPLSTRASQIQQRLGLDVVRELVAEQLSADAYSLAHGLLASLRVREAITTNFDDLYELACKRTFPEGLDVVPWERSAVNRPWLLKAHGDPKRHGPLVLTGESFTGFDSEHKPEAGVLRTMMTLSREILFIGYSLGDSNIQRIIDETEHAYRANDVVNQRIGTVINLTETGIRLGENPVVLGIASDTNEPIEHAGRRLEIYLDYLAWKAACDESSWILDTRYEALLTGDVAKAAARALGAQELPDDDQWQPAERRLVELGRERRNSLPAGQP